MALYEAMEEMVNQMMTELQKKYERIYPVKKAWERLSQMMLNCKTQQELASLVQKHIMFILDEISKSVKQLENPTITAVKQYVDQQFNQKVTLESASDAVYLNSAYLAALFKKETGITFLDYLTGVRIEKSKTLLCDMKYNLSQVAQAVGYSDAKYFGKLFQKYTGIKPQEYRKLFINNLL